MSFTDIYGPDKFGLSFELFPPKTPAGDEALFEHVEELAMYTPSFVTCTYGAGGSTRDKTLQIVSQVKRRFGFRVASHLTCVGSTVEQLSHYLHAAAKEEVDYVVALRGDPPRGQEAFRPVDGGLRFANELVTLIREQFPQFGIAVAGYPEKHMEAESLEIDLQHLKHKVECGADVVITQLFYDNDDFLRFRQLCEQIGIRKPLVPGILPVTNLSQIQRISSMCDARLPAEFVQDLQNAATPEAQFQVGVDHAIRQVRGLIAAGVPGIHFYVLNKSQAARQVLEAVTLPS